LSIGFPHTYDNLFPLAGTGRYFLPVGCWAAALTGAADGRENRAEYALL
jgi:hypothetical protein